MKYLSTDQALEDTAAFTMALQSDPDLGQAGPWIIFGGSYSAQLAAWSRAKYPHLFYAAHASSAPVFAQLDIPGIKYIRQLDYVFVIIINKNDFLLIYC